MAGTCDWKKASLDKLIEEANHQGLNHDEVQRLQTVIFARATADAARMNADAAEKNVVTTWIMGILTFIIAVSAVVQAIAAWGSK